jgi:hypothetical protein
MLSDDDRKRITLEGWIARIESELTVLSLRDAVLDAIQRFYRGSTTGRVIELNLSLAREAEKKAATALADPALEEKARASVLSMLNASSGNSPASSELTQVPSPSDSSSGCPSADAVPTGSPSPNCSP